MDLRSWRIYGQSVGHKGLFTLPGNPTP
uniref:Uncharacterized protein n=1 Tax=Rhizophora mucronata TaxID=61149 RepID=A0A2P2N0F2_RHIMU